MKRYIYYAVFFIFFVSAAILQGCAGTLKDTEDILDQKDATARVEGKNRYEGSTGVSALKTEMRILNEAYKNLIECLILNIPEGIEDPFQEVKKATVYTDAAIKKGEIRLPRGNEKIKQFVDLDRQLRKRIDLIIEASRKKDIKSLRDLTPQFLNGCIQCHYRFRS